MDNNSLLQFDQEGIIPAPAEDEETFLLRAKQCRSLRETICDKLPINAKQELSLPPCAEQAFAKTASLFGIYPKWSPIFFSDQGLLPWHGACTWVIQLANEGPLVGFVQLRKKLAGGSTWGGLYKAEDVLTHEFAHLGRLGFSEPRFEEVLACQVFSSNSRRLISTLFKHKGESAIFAFLIVTLLVFDLFCIFLADFSVYLAFFPLKLLPAAFLLILLIRSLWDARVLEKAKKQVSKWGVSPLPFLYRLTDKEIAFLASSKTGGKTAFKETFFDSSLRWQLLSLYLP